MVIVPHRNAWLKHGRKTVVILRGLSCGQIWEMFLTESFAKRERERFPLANSIITGGRDKSGP